MTLPLSREKLEQLWKKYRLALVVLLAGVTLLVLPKGETHTAETAEVPGYDAFSLAETERRMEEILSRIEGTGKLALMLTLKSGSQLELAEDTDQTTDSDEQRIKSETVTINRGSGQQDVVITQQRYPLYQGAVVVCQGAGKASVRLAVTEAIAALTGLSSDKISVVKWNS